MTRRTFLCGRTFDTVGTSRAAGALGLLSLLFASTCATIHPSYRDQRFVILSSGDFTPPDVQRVREQLEVGLKALERYISAAPPSKFPIVVNLWERWLAYTQSTSLCRYLIERYGKERFVQLYDVPVERVDFERLYEKPAGMLVDEWLSHVRALPLDATAREYFFRMKRLRGR